MLRPRKLKLLQNRTPELVTFADHGGSLPMPNTLCMPMEARVNLGRIACFPVACLVYPVAVLLSLWIAGHALIFEKGYLKIMEHVETRARLEMLHPTQDDCDPFDRDCASNFRSVRELPYCESSSVNQGDCQRNGTNYTKCPCDYLDAYDLEQRAKFDKSHAALLPTCVTTVEEQKIVCDAPCKKSYNITKRSTSYVADIESFKVRIFHSYVRPYQLQQSTMKGDASKSLGFLNECTRLPLALGSDWGWKLWNGDWTPFMELGQRLLVLTVAKDNQKTCTRKHINGTGAMDYYYSYARKWYDTSSGWPEDRSNKWAANAFIALNGTAIELQVGPLLEWLGVNLDDSAETLRRRGVVVNVNIAYRNTMWATRPNHLSPIYDVTFELNTLATPKYVYVLAHAEGQRRTIYDTHGVLFEISVRSEIRSLSRSQLFLLLIECGVVFHFAKYCVLCTGMQFMSNSAAKKLEEHCTVPDDVLNLDGDRVNRSDGDRDRMILLSD